MNLKGFTDNSKYVVELMLPDGRLLVHDLADDSVKRIIYLGTRVYNRINFGSDVNEISEYDSVHYHTAQGAVLTYREDSEGGYFEGVFFMYSGDYFTEGRLYVVLGIDKDKNILVKDKDTGLFLRIPKGAVLSKTPYESWEYDGYNTSVKEGIEVCCVSITEDIVFNGEFEKNPVKVDKGCEVANSFINERGIISGDCPKCGSSKFKVLPMEIVGRVGSVKGIDTTVLVGVCENCGYIGISNKGTIELDLKRV